MTAKEGKSERLNMTTGASVPSGSSEPLAPYEALPTRQLSQMQLVWIRYRRHHLAVFGTGVLLFMILLAIFAPIIAPENVYDQTSNDIFNAQDLAPTLHGGLRYLFGSDAVGHSMTSQIIWGARYSLLIGITSAAIATIIGTIIGAISGFFGGWVDTLLMRTVDVFLTLPALPILLVAAGLLGGGHTSVVLVIGIFSFFGWAFVARLVRGLFLSLRTLEYTEAARAVGVSTMRIIFRHLLPNALRPILVAATLIVAGNIVGEAAIDFLGLGLQYPDTSWGSVLSFAQQEQFRFWWLTIFPGLFLVITIVAINFIGDGLSDALDVRSK